MKIPLFYNPFIPLFHLPPTHSVDRAGLAGLTGWMMVVPRRRRYEMHPELNLVNFAWHFAGPTIFAFSFARLWRCTLGPPTTHLHSRMCT